MVRRPPSANESARHGSDLGSRNSNNGNIDPRRRESASLLLCLAEHILTLGLPSMRWEWVILGIAALCVVDGCSRPIGVSVPSEAASALVLVRSDGEIQGIAYDLGDPVPPVLTTGLDHEAGSILALDCPLAAYGLSSGPLRIVVAETWTNVTRRIPAHREALPLGYLEELPAEDIQRVFLSAPGWIGRLVQAEAIDPERSFVLDIGLDRPKALASFGEDAVLSWTWSPVVVRASPGRTAFDWFFPHVHEFVVSVVGRKGPGPPEVEVLTDGSLLAPVPEIHRVRRTDTTTVAGPATLDRRFRPRAATSDPSESGELIALGTGSDGVNADSEGIEFRGPTWAAIRSAGEWSLLRINEPFINGAVTAGKRGQIWEVAFQSGSHYMITPEGTVRSAKAAIAVARAGSYFAHATPQRTVIFESIDGERVFSHGPFDDIRFLVGSPEGVLTSDGRSLFWLSAVSPCETPKYWAATNEERILQAVQTRSSLAVLVTYDGRSGEVVWIPFSGSVSE